MSANRAAFHNLFVKLRATSNRSLTTCPLGNALSSAFTAHWVENALLHFGAIDLRMREVFSRLVGEGLAVGTLELHRHPNVLCLGGEVGQAKPQGVGAELADNVDRIDAVTLCLRHRVAVAV